MSIIDYKDPIIPSWRIDENGDKYSKEILNEEHQVIGNKIVLNELPDIKYRVFINENFVEININEEITEENQFKVDYTTGLITVHNSLDGQFITVGKYYGRGIINYPASRVWTETSADGEVTETLKDIIDTNKIYFQEPVDTYAEIATAYPNPQVGWAVQVLNDGENTNKIYRWDGSEWKYINKINISGLQSQIDELENKITDIENQDLNNRISIIENQDLNNRISTIENQDLDNRLTTLENNINSPEYTPEIYNTSSIFTVGQGTDENGNALDYSDSIVNGQVSDIEIEGRTITNIIKNGNFEDGTTNWGSGGSTLSVSNNILTQTSETTGNIPLLQEISSNNLGGHKLYLAANVRAKSSNISKITLYTYNGDDIVVASEISPEINKWQQISGIVTQPTTGSYVRYYLRQQTNSVGTELDAKEVMAIDLTAIGLENLTLEECKERFNFFTGTKSTFNVRLKSVGKNLFNGKTEIGTLVLGEPSESTTRARTKNFIRVKQSTQYTLKLPTGYSGVNLFYYDINKNYISYESIGTNQKTFITPSNASYIKFTILKGDGTETITSDDLIVLEVIQLQEGTTVTDEEYKEDLCYIQLPQEVIDNGGLGSLPNGTKDEVSEENGTYKVKKNTWKYIIQSEDITLRISGENVEVYQIQRPDVKRLANGSKHLLHEDFVEGISGATFDETQNVGRMYGNPSDDYIRFVFETGATLTDAQNALAGTSLIYQLAEPNYYELKGVTPLQVFENGTVYVEPFLRKAIKYDTTNGNGFDFPIKISEIEKIEDINGNELDLESVTLATDGMSATCTTANEGEVYTVYAYIDSAENVTPTTVMKLPINSKAQIEGNNKAIQQLGYDIETLQDKIDILILNTFS